MKRRDENMDKENKCILIIQIIITITAILFFINQPNKLELVNGNTGENFNAFESFIYFNFILWIFGVLWGACLFVMVVEGYLLIKGLYCLIKQEEKINNDMEKIFGIQMPYSIAMGYISLLIVLLVKI